ncbi:hypothetical protein OX283_012675 [Flavobacterium sp. SUN052]|uniref:hypothetical protein n=1 Tax=Flavobacterium sp. SUN052 TaxID=3002441 RepID=UPI00237D3B2D|nr:hypothetical protein [Flavobacterium sp. SUN052]MEC4005517.1 hypothetical protein [Flavobacterium sp. SUN052]
MQNFKESGFVKSFPQLSKLPITISEKSLIELVLSYTDNGQLFYMNYKDIAPYIGFSKPQSVKNLVHTLRKKGYITSKQSHNFNGSTGGSSTSIVVNEDFINKQLSSIIKAENKANKADLNCDIQIDKIVVDSPKIVDQNEDNSLVYEFYKMCVLCDKSEIVNGLVADFIPKDDNFTPDDDFENGVENHLIKIFNDVVLQRNDLKEMYVNIR